MSTKAAKFMTPTFVLPEGWTSERERSFERTVLYTVRMPNRLGYLTLDFTNRRFAPGVGGPVSSSRSKSTRVYSHRGWCQQLADDAIAWARRELGAP